MSFKDTPEMNYLNKLSNTKNFDDFDLNNLLIRLKNVEGSIGILASKIDKLDDRLAALRRDHDNLCLDTGGRDY